MTEQESKIYQLIARYNGIKARDIAEHLGVDRRDVNALLSKSPALKAVVFQDEEYKWRLKASSSSASKNEAAKYPAADKELKNLCNYYLNCLTLESKNSVSQFLTSRYELAYEPIESLSKEAFAQPKVANYLAKIKAARDKTAYIGYPVRIFTIKSNKGTFRKIAPVFLFSILFDSGTYEIDWTPIINIEVLKAYSEGGSDTVAAELVKLESDLGINRSDAEIEPDELAMRLTQVRQWDYVENIDPYNIYIAADMSSLPDGICNRAVVIEAERSNFTVGLESELSMLANMSEEDYKGTALYSWIKGDCSHSSSEEIKPLLEVLPLNSEQADAVNSALKSDLTIVTGPPGTGKSQVVTDLLINIAWNGKTALFTSKNNKAVDVVDQRVNGLCKRPFVLRIGNAHYASRLADIVEGLLNTSSTSADKDEAEYYLQEYTTRANRTNKILAIKSQTMQARNQLDVIEQDYCAVRDKMKGIFDKVSSDDIGKARCVAEKYHKAYIASIKEKQSFFTRLFWNMVKEKRIAVKDETFSEYCKVFSTFMLPLIAKDADEDSVEDMLIEAYDFEKALDVTLKYKSALEEFKNKAALELADKKLAKNKEAIAEVSGKLWSKWLRTQAVTFSPQDRRDMLEFLTTMRLSDDIDLSNNPSLKKQYLRVSAEMTKYLQCWAVTSLSAKGRVPFTAGLFDYVIVDEASQCDIASIIPLLYRAKRAVIIGDPQQLTHISQLSGNQDLALLQKYQVSPIWSYTKNSLYRLAESEINVDRIIQLKDHFRCCADIIEFSNEEYYKGNLRTATRYDRLKTPAGDKPGVRWIDVQGETLRPSSGSAYNTQEVSSIVKELKRLISVGYDGTIGVTTPFRRQAEEIRRALKSEEPGLLGELESKHEFIADTVHKFQGDERDLMIFSTVISDGAAASSVGFLKNTPNLFNVAITRARAVLVVVGNFNYCANSGVDYLRNFTDYYTKLKREVTPKNKIQVPPNTRSYPEDINNSEYISEWEKVFYTALYDAGINVVPQYREDKYLLDLALLCPDGRKLDIEVDGERYHRQWNGELCYRDQLRNQRMFELGWDVRRFWVYQIRDNLDWCVEEVKNWLQTDTLKAITFSQ